MTDRTYNAVRAPLQLGFDASTYIDPKLAKRFLEAGYATAFRYVKKRRRVYDTPQKWPVSLSHRELAELVDAGLKVSLVQFVVPEVSGGGGGYENGKRLGDAAGWNAKTLKAPKGITVWCDAEGWEDRGRADILAYLNGWSDGCKAYGYRPGLYVGAGLGRVGKMVTGEDLSELPGFAAYWRAASIVPQVPNRGWTVIQGLQVKVFGEPIDQDMIALDHRAKRAGDRFKVIGK
jgi:hypothetical protein